MLNSSGAESLVRSVMPDATPIDFDKLRVTVGALTNRLAQRDYEGVRKLVRASRLGSLEFERALVRYGRQLVPLPATALQAINVVPVSNSQPQRWSAVVPLWTQEEGRSDLSLELTLEDSPAPLYGVEIDDLHVL